MSFCLVGSFPIRAPGIRHPGPAPGTASVTGTRPGLGWVWGRGTKLPSPGSSHHASGSGLGLRMPGQGPPQPAHSWHGRAEPGGEGLPRAGHRALEADRIQCAHPASPAPPALCTRLLSPGLSGGEGPCISHGCGPWPRGQLSDLRASGLLPVDRRGAEGLLGPWVARQKQAGSWWGSCDRRGPQGSRKCWALGFWDSLPEGRADPTASRAGPHGRHCPPERIG